LLASIGFKYVLQDQEQTGLPLLEQSYRLSRGVQDLAVRAVSACSLAEALADQDSASPRPETLLAEGLRGLPREAEFALDRSFCLLRGSRVAAEAGNASLAIGRAQDAIQALAQVPFEHEMSQLMAYSDLAEAYRQAGRFRDAMAVFEQIWPR